MSQVGSLGVKITAPVAKHWDARPNIFQHGGRDIGAYQFLTISRSGRQNDAVWIDDGGSAATGDALVPPDTVRDDHVALVFYGAGHCQGAEVLGSRKWPGCGID